MADIEKKKIAIIHPQFLVLGGSEMFALFLIEILKKDYDVTLITTSQVNLEEMNKYAGTYLTLNNINIISIAEPKWCKDICYSIRNYRLAMFCQKVSLKFDLMISTYNIMYFGKRGIQCIADFSFDDALRIKFDPVSKANHQRRSWFKKVHRSIGKMLFDLLKEKCKKNFTIVNSYWTQQVMKEFYHIESAVVYPPVPDKFSDAFDWHKRDNGFVYLGRLSPEKQIEKIIRIIKKVRENNPEICLYIIGRLNNSFYVNNVKKICDDNRQWCFLKDQMQEEEKTAFISKRKFGISARDNEPFGMSIAEMIKLGCIVFVPNGGGQKEIVLDKRLIFNDENDAVSKIDHVLAYPDIQMQLKNTLYANSQKFSMKQFESSFKKIIENFV